MAINIPANMMGFLPILSDKPPKTINSGVAINKATATNLSD